MLSLILLDVNDNAPELPEVDKFTPVISENNNLVFKQQALFHT